MFDQDPAMAEATRRKIYDMLVADKMRVQGFHYPIPANGWVRRMAPATGGAGAMEPDHLTHNVIPGRAPARTRDLDLVTSRFPGAQLRTWRLRLRRIPE